MRLLHSAARTSARFDDPNLVSHAGLVPLMRLAQRCDLAGLVETHVQSLEPTGANAGLKVPAIVAGMASGADSIDDLDVLRHGGMSMLFAGVRAPSTLGSFLRSLNWGNVRQLDAVNRRMLAALAAHAPVLAGADRVAYLDIDSMQRRVFGPKKQGAGFGPAKVGGYEVALRGLNPLIASISTPTAAPLVAGTRLRGGSAGSARGAASFVAEAIGTARGAGATGTLTARMDSAFYNAATVAACRRADVRFSITARNDPKIRRTIATIPESDWTPIRYPGAVWDDDEARWVSDAEVAEIDYTAFASNKRTAVTARLIVRRVRRLARPGQGELLPAWRYHAVFTDSPLTMLEAETSHRDHAIIEQLNADLIDGPLAHLPSGHFAANAAWLSCAALAHNLTRAAGALASTFHGKARGATLRRELINLAGRIAHRGRDHVVLHLPEHWPCQDAWTDLFDTTHHARGPTTAAA
jgi:hypothetical protein